MLLVLHNLPTYMNYAEIKQLIHSKCGLSHVILDNLVNEGLTKKVTVGLADSADAAIFARKINGLYIGGQQLYVEDVRIEKESEQPYRSSKAPVPYSSRDAFVGRDVPTLMGPGLSEVVMANTNPLGNSMGMMNYNMAMGNYFMPSTMNAAVPMAQHMTRFNQAQEPAMSEIAQMYDQSRQALNFDRSMNEDNHRSRLDREPKGRASIHYSSPPRRGPDNFDSRNRRSEFSADRDRGSNVNFDNNQMWNQQNAAIQVLNSEPIRRSRWTEDTEHTQLSKASGQQNHSDKYGNFYNMLPAADFALGNRQNSLFENKRDDSRQPPKRVRSKWDEEPQPKRPAPSGMLERPSRNSNWKESAFVESDAYSSNTNMSVPNTWNKTISKSSGFTPNTVPDNRYSSAPQKRNEVVSMEKQMMKSNTWRGQATSTLSKEIAWKFRVNIKTDNFMLAQLKIAIRSRINKILKNDIHATPERIQELFRAKHNSDNDVNIYREALKFVNLNKEKEEKPEPTIEEMTDKMTMLPPKVYPKANANTSGMATKMQKNFAKKPFSNVPPPKNFDKKPFANAPPQKNFNKKPFGNAPLQKNFDKKVNKKMETKMNIETDQETGLPKYPNSDKKTLAMIKNLEKRELSGEQVYELPSDLQKIVEGHCDTLCDLFMGECLNPEDKEEENVCEEINNVAADEFRKVIRLQLIKRILNITNGLVIQIYFSFKPPRKPLLEDFLQKYDVICLKKATGEKKYVASFGSFKGYDALNSLNNAVVENVNLNFRPRIATGQKAKRGAGRKAFVKVHSKFTKPPGQDDGTIGDETVENYNAKTNDVDNVKEEDVGVKTEMDDNATDVQTEDDTKVDNVNGNPIYPKDEAAGDIAEQSENTQETNDNIEQFTDDVNEKEFNQEYSNDEVEHNDGEEEHNDDEEVHDDGEEELNDSEDQLNNVKEYNDDGNNVDDANEIENVDENDLEDW